MSWCVMARHGARHDCCLGEAAALEEDGAEPVGAGGTARVGRERGAVVVARVLEVLEVAPGLGLDERLLIVRAHRGRGFGGDGGSGSGLCVRQLPASDLTSDDSLIVCGGGAIRPYEPQ